MVDKFCMECGSSRSPRKFCKGKCQTCYERTRRNSKPLQLLVCSSCGPISTKKLINSLCLKCYTKHYRLNKKTLKTCPICKREKAFFGLTCRGCETANWRSKNPGKNVSYVAKRRADKLKATPSWADLKEIDLFYKNCPKDMQVDHVIPLRHENICGLHILVNLQYLSKEENYHKNNQFDGTIENSGWRRYVGG